LRHGVSRSDTKGSNKGHTGNTFNRARIELADLPCWLLVLDPHDRPHVTSREALDLLLKPQRLIATLRT
jgi:hypothetical protein